MANVDSAVETTLDEEMLAEIAAFGEERAVDAGEVLYRPGDDLSFFFVVLEGEVQAVRGQGDDEIVVATAGPGGFLGELNLLTGQRPFLLSRVSKPGRLLAVPLDELRRLLSTKPDVSDTIFRTFVARRRMLRSGEGAGAILIIGSRYSSEALALRAFAHRNALPHTWVDLDEVSDRAATLDRFGADAADVPLVITPTARLNRPSPGQLAELLGLTYHATPGFLADLVVVGAGPAGLAAAVYGASEGLTTISLDAVAAGGQAGASSRIENYVGFPNGVSGDELVGRASMQAIRLGARMNAPCEVIGWRAEHGFHVVELAGGSEIPSRAVIVASGARYRRLPVENLERYEGAGVYYAATDLEARMCSGYDVIVVGGGNSAGQASIYMAQQGSRVSLVIRGADLTSSMSEYLIGRIEADPRITLLTHTEVREMTGDTYLEHVTLEHKPTAERRTVPCRGLFCFIGAVPATGWLNGSVALDGDGFVLTDRSLPDDVARSADFAGRHPLPFETSAPGVFAVGDVRSGSMKRVAAAVGEGSSAVRSVHDYLALHHQGNGH